MLLTFKQKRSLTTRKLLTSKLSIQKSMGQGKNWRRKKLRDLPEFVLSNLSWRATYYAIQTLSLYDLTVCAKRVWLFTFPATFLFWGFFEKRKNFEKQLHVLCRIDVNKNIPNKNYSHAKLKSCFSFEKNVILFRLFLKTTIWRIRTKAGHFEWWKELEQIIIKVIFWAENNIFTNFSAHNQIRCLFWEQQDTAASTFFRVDITNELFLSKVWK